MLRLLYDCQTDLIIFRAPGNLSGSGIFLKPQVKGRRRCVAALRRSLE